MVASNHRNVATTLSGVELKNAFARATRFLEEYKEAINTLNVFPVPDGDTGTNLLLTMKSVIEEAAKERSRSAEKASAAMARGALLGARGNSGVILSQFLQGVARGMEGLDDVWAKDLAQALEMAGGSIGTGAASPVLEGVKRVRPVHHLDYALKILRSLDD